VAAAAVLAVVAQTRMGLLVDRVVELDQQGRQGALEQAGKVIMVGTLMMEAVPMKTAAAAAARMGMEEVLPLIRQDQVVLGFLLL
jgi:hypothetical protein